MLPGAPEHGRSWNLAFIGAKVSFEAKIKKSESLQTEGRHFRSMICEINDV